MTDTPIVPTLQPVDASRKIEVQKGGGESNVILCVYDPDSDTIEIKHGGSLFAINLFFLRDFARTSQRKTYRVYETDLPCGHDSGTALDENQTWVCSTCGQPV